MTTDSYRSGYERGELIASCSRKDVIEADTAEKLGKLAGRKLKIVSQIPDDWMQNYDDWKIGFWDGFMHKAEDMRQKRRP